MSWLKPKLAPGERILVALPGREDQGFWAGMGGFLVVVEVALVVAMDAFFGIDRLTTAIVFGGSFALLAFALSRWQLIVTDRRLLRRRGLRSRVEEIALDEVEDVRTEMGGFTERIVIRANGRELTISTMIGVDPAPIVKAIAKAKEGA